MIRRNAETKGYSDILSLISCEFNRNINDLYYEDEFDQFHYDGEGIFIPADFKYIYEKELDGFMFPSIRLKRFRVAPDNPFFCINTREAKKKWGSLKSYCEFCNSQFRR